MFIRVLFPDPDAPISATISPRSMDSEMLAQHRDLDFAQIIRLANVFRVG